MSVLPKWVEPWQRWALALSVAFLAGTAPQVSFSASRIVAKAPECPLAGARVVGFARALDGGGFLTADGEEVRLAGILAPGAGGEAVRSNAVRSSRVPLVPF